MLCVSNVSYSVALNEQFVGPIIPGRDLRQGDPLSPYLFIICVEELSAMMTDVKTSSDIHGCRISRGAPIVSHLLLVDYSFFFNTPM